MQTRKANGFLMQAYTGSGWDAPGDTKSEGDVHQCGSNVVVIGSMEGICGSTADCNGGVCVPDTAETYTCQCTAPACGPQCLNTTDALGECGGSCTADADNDNICDDVDECVGTLDACNVCNGDGAIYECGCSGIPAGDCDCNGNQNDALGVCDGTCAADANGNGVCDSDEVPVAPAGPSTCPDDTSGLTAAEYINAQCCQCN